MDNFKKFLETIFVCGVIAFMLLGSVIVLIQIYCVITVNGALSIYITKSLGKFTFAIATITGLIGFVQGYLNGWSMGD